MYNVTEDKIDFILEDIAKRGIVTEDVRYNILDHVCCIIENEMNNDQNFYEFYQHVIARFYQKELGEIQEETNDLLTFKHYYAMKRTLKIAGVVSITLIILGIVFKYLHLMGAGVLIVLGLAFFSLLFIPLNIVLKFKDDKASSNRIIMTIGMITASTETIGILFKIMHWPYANILMLSSLIAFTVIFIPTYFIIKYKDPESKFNAIINTTFMIGAVGMLFALMYSGPSKKTEEMLNESNLTHSQQISVEKTDQEIAPD